MSIDLSYGTLSHKGLHMADLEAVITRFIRENFIAGRSDAVLDAGTSLIESGIMDSTGVLELVEYLETTFSIKIEDEELVPENLETIANIVRFLASKGVGA